MRRTLSVPALVCACLGLTAGAAQAAHWALQTTPNPNLIANGFTGVSCVKPSACEGVGQGFEASWDGTSWQLQPDIAPDVLQAVSCARANACTAVGGGVAARWDGTNWALQSLPATPASTELDAVSCPTISFCLAVGPPGVAERWNGTAWSTQPLVQLSSADLLSGVSCRSASACTAVGSTQAGPPGSSPTVPLIERWNGVSWSVQPSLLPAGSSSGALNGVSCFSAHRCMAVGVSAGLDPLAERWNGTAWKLLSTPTPQQTPVAFLTGVSCRTGRFCIASGSRTIDSDMVAGSYALRWNGTSWKLTGAPFGDQGSTIPTGSVSCPALGRCEAVGMTGPFPSSTASDNLAAQYVG